VDDLGHSELSSLDLHSGRTFASFVDRDTEGLKPDELKSLDKALKEALSFAKRPHGWLVFTGPYGCGKTHLAAAIANQRAGLGDPPLFVMVPDLLDHLRAAFSPNSGTSYDRRFDEVRTAPLLVLDDMGSQSATPWAREKLYQLLNYRYNRELPTVITVASDMLKDVDERVRTRMMDERICNVVTITAPAFVGTKKKTGRR
jgi:DNA replication protein DnaC